MNLQNEFLKSILIVDDELYIRQSLFNYFEDCEWQAFMAESGESALALLQTQPCCAAIVDIRMGGMDGEAFIRKTYEKYPGMVFLICTGSPEYELPEDLQQLPCVADTVFGKPVTNIDELEKTITKLLYDNKTEFPGMV